MPENRWAVNAARKLADAIVENLPYFPTDGERQLTVLRVARIIVAEYCLARGPAVDPFDDIRASGAAVCPKCGLAYRDHPDDPWILSDTGEPFLVIACDGRRLKL